MADRLITGFAGAFWLDESADRLITGFHSAAYDTAVGGAASVAVPSATLGYTLSAPGISTGTAPTLPAALQVRHRSPLLRM